VHDPAGEVTGVWRIRPAMEGKVDRWGLGPKAGGCSRLFEAEGPVLVVAEGVEDALAARELTGWPAWAALSASNMKVLKLPAIYAEVLILADADETGRAAAHTLAQRLRAEGRQARVLKPAAGKDPNDVLLAGRAA
jgi:DNA primase